MEKIFLRNYTASDAMTTHLVTVDQDASLREVMETLVENQVSGVPVVDGVGRCLGVVSATDILGFEQEHSETVNEANEDVAQVFDAEKQQWESIRLSAFALEEFADTPVQRIMSIEPMIVGPKTPIGDVARMMTEEKIHRVLVVNDRKKLQGIVSTMDIVQLVAQS